MKQYIIVDRSLKMSKGKLAGQVAHASIGATKLLPRYLINNWLENDYQPKIILRVDSANELLHYYNRCINNGYKPYKVKNITPDKWENKITCFGVGPYPEEELNDIFKDLKLL